MYEKNLTLVQFIFLLSFQWRDVKIVLILFLFERRENKTKRVIKKETLL